MIRHQTTGDGGRGTGDGVMGDGGGESPGGWWGLWESSTTWQPSTTRHEGVPGLGSQMSYAGRQARNRWRCNVDVPSGV